MTQVLGTRSAVISIAQQLAWLGAALRTSPYDETIASCTPKIRDITIADSSSTQTVLCKIDFSMDRLDTTADALCWQALFYKKVLVQRFPVARRKQGISGLDTSLDVMAQLIQAQYITWFNDIPFIKGFSALAVPSVIEKGILIWHLIFNEDWSRISYTDRSADYNYPKLNLLHAMIFKVQSIYSDGP